MGAKGEDPTKTINKPITKKTRNIGMSHQSFLCHRKEKNSAKVLIFSFIFSQ